MESNQTSTEPSAVEAPLMTLKRKSEEFLKNLNVVARTPKDPKKQKVFTATLIGAKLNKEGRDQYAQTPKAFFQELNGEFDFTFDPCPSNPTADGLSIDWGERNFVNPPYKDCKKWLKKAVQQRDLGKLVVMLLPARTNTKWFHKYCLEQPDCEIRFIRGKLTFEGYDRQAPFASMVVIFKPKHE